MKSDILLCEYSYHAEKKHVSWQDGLDYYFIRLQTEGNCTVKLNGITKQLYPGDLLLCKPEDRCELFIEEYTDKSGERSISSGDYFLLARGIWLDEWWKREDRPTIQHIHDTKKLTVLWKEIILEKRRIYDKDAELLDYLTRSLCLSVDIAIKDTHLYQNRLTSPVLAMKRYIEEHATQSIKIQDVANHAGFSVSRASHLFKERFGKTIIEYAVEIRLNTAVKLIKYSDIPLEQIAEISGFGSYTYFHRVFRKHHGQSPGRFSIDAT
ncbi:helix-turn-helix domain-containing protein [Sediminibacillus massiliensis]|uniref:helix-turn-helix domain-containing protein n=1 Tax=Sediminibacillus massiliensis TaxID=1926277 RepID=UPI00098855F0|nr:AraC family transcriptional regulator [Sediminibacillus massiliensis]